MSKARQLADLGNVYDDGALSNRNMVVNGGMTVNQRGNSTGVTGIGYYGPDRFQTVLNSAGTWSVSQSSTAPDGFGSSFKFDCTTADTPSGANDYLILYHTLEGQDLQRLKKGTSSAEKSTLSFWIRSNKTGTYQVNMQDQDNSRLTGKTYTIDAANTWERKVITFDGDTTGAYTNDANASLNLEWWLAAGSTFTSGAVPTSWEALTQADRAAGLNVNLADSTSNELYITGVQLEIGDTSTPFEHRSYGDELARCQRYYAETGFNVEDYATAGGEYYHDPVYFPMSMRTAPSVTIVNGNVTNINSTNAYDTDLTSLRVEIQSTSSGRAVNLGGTVKLDAEL
jgi:hypothetical protein